MYLIEEHEGPQCAWCLGPLGDPTFRIDQKDIICDNCVGLVRDINAHNGELTIASVSFNGRTFNLEPPLSLHLSIQHDEAGYRWISGAHEELGNSAIIGLGTNSEPEADGGSVEELIENVANRLGEWYCYTEEKAQGAEEAEEREHYGEYLSDLQERMHEVTPVRAGLAERRE